MMCQWIHWLVRPRFVNIPRSQQQDQVVTSGEKVAAKLTMLTEPLIATKTKPDSRSLASTHPS